jgi:Protein of unknown function (DUF2380)
MSVVAHGSRIAAGLKGLAVLALAAACGPAWPEAPASAPIRLAVFDFELEDASPPAVLQGKITSGEDAMSRVSSAARQELAQSGRYALVDVSKADAPPVKSRSLRNCDGCEAALAMQLGAEQSLIGVLIRATATDYYLLIRIRDARTGKIIDQQSANFAGSEEGWPTGARMLIRHQVLAPHD